ncbi:D-aminopeptidase [Dyadobacter sp. BE34]|uniref:D-aminopeptidase n=1 Tax=Dyadobacter fermentans TaxID=94254 RepID=A0ABU1R3E6_9BACT|nr:MULTISPECIES: P1 family peptidase [Dyadobacter]MDR6807752.1 D-aminopeptidase [Dyadobacter fermentans]MDR7045493.1 D-aminopeptidase [Dyadobacter sp. BE242]MDR7199806.1 D-aminopeptidase [Dyadobacter sp. BE34]MDR7217735.1 D-aminopeptidase [Dyadobacter sp. BE31]MDR7265697.1 D-aminopeptidase [Dyadobacter sp. BE32]
MKRLFSLLLILPITLAAQKRPRDLGIKIGVLPTGALNAITDVTGVKVGQVTLTEGADVRTGVTAILPHDGNMFQQKVQAAMYIGNGFGKMTGYSQVEELGTIESPIVLTNTLSVPTAADAVIDWTLGQKGNENVRSVNPVIGETNDGFLNDIRGRHVRKDHVLNALAQAETGPVAEGNVGAGTGTVCFGWKGGIGTASRKLPEKLGNYTIGVLVQTNFGGVLKVNGVPVGQELGKYAFKEALDKSSDGSCMMVIATDAPLDARNLKRLAKRVMLGMAQTGGIAANGSGDYVIAFSTANKVLHETSEAVFSSAFLHNDYVSPLFMAAMEATEEAIINSLFMARTSEGTQGHKVEELPKDKVLEIMRKYGRIKE